MFISLCSPEIVNLLWKCSALISGLKQKWLFGCFDVYIYIYEEIFLLKGTVLLFSKRVYNK